MHHRHPGSASTAGISWGCVRSTADPATSAYLLLITTAQSSTPASGSTTGASSYYSCCASSCSSHFVWPGSSSTSSPREWMLGAYRWCPCCWCCGQCAACCWASICGWWHPMSPPVTFIFTQTKCSRQSLSGIWIKMSRTWSNRTRDQWGHLVREYVLTFTCTGQPCAQNSPSPGKIITTLLVSSIIESLIPEIWTLLIILPL